ncbi:MAG: RICIN domain-containing protein [Myxococcaceae bacterium]|nr:RICIN domain-containing protein [Myxococcaceae bacterium]
MSRALLPLVALCACTGDIFAAPGTHPTGGTGGSDDPVIFDPSIFEPVVELTATVIKQAPEPDAPGRFATVSWDLQTDVTDPARALPATVSLDVRVLANGEVELLNPRFALTAAATSQLVFNKVHVATAAAESAAFAPAGATVKSVRDVVLAPGLVGVVAGSSPLALSLEFAARATRDAPVVVPVEPTPPMETPDAGTGTPQRPVLTDGETYVLHTTCAAATVLAVEDASPDDNAPLVLSPAAGATGHRFTVEAQALGGVMLVALHSGRAINVPRGSLTAGTQLIQWNAADFAHPNQRWVPHREADGSYRLQGVQSGLYIDANGADVVQAALGASCAQRFVLERVE